MSFFVQDMSGLALATVIAPLVLYLPGFGLLRLLGIAGFTIQSGWQRLGWAMLLGISLLPALDVLAIRAFAMPGMVALNLLLALYGAPLLRGIDRRAATPALIAIGLCWWFICAWSYVDLDIGDRLYQSLIAIDMVKHAAVVEQIARQGIPFTDPFYARAGIAGYYHYFYVWGAVIRWLGGFHISAPMAFAATAFWTGPAVVALAWRVMADAALIRPGRDRRVILIAILLCALAGTDLLFMGLRYVIVHRLEAQVDIWNTELRAFGTSLLWVPHHVAAMIAAWTGMLLATRIGGTSWGQRVPMMLAAGTAFATMFGESVWIAFTIAPLLAGWAVCRLARRDGWLLGAGITALCLSLPQMHDLMLGRSAEAFPIGFHVRSFTIFLAQDDLATQLWCLLLLPINYAMEFGIGAIGAWAYWRMRKAGEQNGRLVRRLLFWSFVVSLLIGGLVESTIINNDLGWRAVLFASFSILVWTAAVGQNIRSVASLSAIAGSLILLGAAGTLWDLAGLRFYQTPVLPLTPIGLNRSPRYDHAMRIAYGWADAHLPEGAVVQHNPGLTHRAVDFGLYGRHWPAVADKFAHLFGAGAQEMAKRITMLMPVFQRPMPESDLLHRARTEKVDYLLFTARDPVWIAAKGPPPYLRCVYRDAELCIAPVQGRVHP